MPEDAASRSKGKAKNKPGVSISRLWNFSGVILNGYKSVGRLADRRSQDGLVVDNTKRGLEAIASGGAEID